MFSQDRSSLRHYYHQTWQKYCQHQPLDALETQIATVIQEHPEYHAWVNAKEGLDADFLPEAGDTNPFLHMGLHLGLREQVATDRPIGIRALYQQLTSQDAYHAVEHRMMECLAESIWQAQRQHTMPDETAYWTCLTQLRLK